ncbi:type II toxin-antitoxin system HicA family toxin [uncultured Thiodictyon sp.]|uniref:type II toxin-antitoxin system HicA family toxin n=1 Tax=uncultured Thiodictyon sp. TaxID=1846217 RepID=UPI0025DF1CCE|nr:type II toxin-antitoxin system HicA family toxin [uncultured Thiodictyon sp.]
MRGAGFREIPGAGKGSHRKLVHPKFSGAVTLSGRLGDDVKKYQEREVTTAIETVTK